MNKAQEKPAMIKHRTDFRVVVDVATGWGFYRKPEAQQEKEMQWDADSIKEFIRDHRSMDIHDVRVEWDTTYSCPFCGHSYDAPPNLVDCCDEGIDSFNPHIRTDFARE